MTTERRAWPLAARLVLTYVLITAAVLLVVTGLLYHLTRTHLRNALDDSLSAAVASFSEGPARDVAVPDDLAPAARRWLAVRGFPEGEVAAVRTSGGRVLSAAGGLDVDALPPEALVASASRWWEVEASGATVRLLTVPLVLGGEQAGTLAVGGSLEGIERTLATVLAGAGVAGAVGLVVAAALGLAGVRRTLRPLRRISSRAQEVETSGDLSIRVAGEGPRDEVGRLAETFDAMLGRLEESFRSQQRFVADASHELRTPLTVVRGQLELLGDRLEVAADREAVGTAMGEVDRMRRIVEELLLLARLDEGLALVREPVEVELVMQEALVRGLAGERRRSSVETEPGLFADADPERLLQILTNLVANAVRHAGDEAAIALRGRRRSDGRVEVEVADTGTGIPPDELPHVRSRLYRGARARATAGAGLGLAIADSLVRAMGGELRVESVLGEGTTFSVRLPPGRVPAPAEGSSSRC